MHRFINYLFVTLSIAVMLVVTPASAAEFDEYYPVAYGSARITGSSPGIDLPDRIVCSHNPDGTYRGIFEYDVTAIPADHVVTKATIFIQPKDSTPQETLVEIYTYPGVDGIIKLAEATDLTGATLAHTLKADSGWDNATFIGIDISEIIADLISSGDRYPGFILKLADETIEDYAEIKGPDPHKLPASLKMIIKHRPPHSLVRDRLHPMCIGGHNIPIGENV